MENVSELVNSTRAALPEADGVGVGLEIALGILALFFLFLGCAVCASCEGGGIGAGMPGPSKTDIRRSPNPYP